jgi:hypothetical protein
MNEFASGRQPVTIVELDQDFCNLEYGVAPCTAAIGTTGDRKCYNTRITCQDAANYDRGNLTLKFSDIEVRGEIIIPSLVSVTSTPTEINIGNSDRNSAPLGRRASVNIVIQDHPYDDALVDKYERDFDPMKRGTFWSKWIARNPFYQNRLIRIKEGYLGQSLNEMQTRHYVINQINGPDSNGRVTIIANDILKLAEDDRAQCPRPSNGRLAASIDDSDTSFSLLPTGIGSEYPASGIGIIEKELISYTRSGDNITITGRALRGTEAAEHDADSAFQVVQVFNNVRVDALIKTLLEDFGNIDSSYIPFSAWEAEAGTFLAGFNLTAWITEPTGVSELIGEIAQQCLCYIWWDERAQEIRFRSIRPAIQEDIIKNITQDNNIIANSVKIERDPKQRISQLWFYFRQINPTLSLTDATNYGRTDIRVDLDAESADQFGERRVRRIFSRWLDETNEGEIIATTTRLLERYKVNPTYVYFSLDAKDRDLKVGDVISFTHRSFVDDTGNFSVEALQVIRLDEAEAGHRINYKCQFFGFALTGVGARSVFIMANDAPDYDAASDDQKLFGGWIAENEAPYFPDDGDAYRIV